MSKTLSNLLLSVLVVVVGVILAGLFLNVAGQGMVGDWLKSIAKQTTNGYGDAQA